MIAKRQLCGLFAQTLNFSRLILMKGQEGLAMDLVEESATLAQTTT